MAIDPARETAIIAALTALNSAGLLLDPVRRDALPGAVVIADAADAAGLLGDDLGHIEAELDQLISSGGFVTSGIYTKRGYSLAALLTAIGV